MPRINIAEEDRTLTSSVEQLYNVVYVPGFSSKQENGLEAHVPYTFTSLTDFKSKVEPATFGIEEHYVKSEWANTIGGVSRTDSVPDDEIMFNEGDEDPSYVYAYTLLSMGVPVVYERVNTSFEFETKTPSSGSNIGFKTGTEAPGTLAPTDVTKSINNEYYIQVTEVEDNDNTSYEYELYLYKGPIGASGANVWEDVTNKKSFEVEGDATPTSLVIYAISAKEMYAYLETRFKGGAEHLDNPLFDRNSTQIKYLTTGGYPVFEYKNNAIVKDMLDLASPEDTVTVDDILVGRGDCIVLVDHTINPDRPLIGTGSVFDNLQSYGTIHKSWGAMISPGIEYEGKNMVGSFAYLISMAKAVQNNPNWLAIAGVNRGVVPGATKLLTNNRMTRAIADSYMVNGKMNLQGDRYSAFINPITNIRPYGLTIWGNRTLIDTQIGKEQALYYLNMRSLLCEIKKRCYSASEQLMFEQNSDVLWINFKNFITPLLDQMASSYGISGYKINREVVEGKAKLKAVIKVFPIYAVEDFDITVVLTNEDEVVVEE